MTNKHKITALIPRIIVYLIAKRHTSFALCSSSVLYPLYHNLNKHAQHRQLEILAHLMHLPEEHDVVCLWVLLKIVLL